MLPFALKNRTITTHITKPAKTSTRKYYIEKNINACKDLTSKMIDSGNFLAGEALAIASHSGVGAACGGGMGGTYGGGSGY